MTVTVRQLLREFKDIKTKLIENKVDKVVIPIEDKYLELTLHKKKNTAANIAKLFRDNPYKVEIKRPDIFDRMFNRDD